VISEIPEIGISTTEELFQEFDECHKPEPEEQRELLSVGAMALDLNQLNARELRKLCSEYNIQWRDARGKNRHMKTDVMRQQLAQRFING
jgi:hypothetical protein